ncbi:MAG: tRNA (5-methylaminomethyl-2-thiouridine)(34)-methyltransferase MnmD [Rhodobacteraceae bacterium]|nr:tRNA (5-methylaminomethyl-2-thiouridine)(34)-methyltransferase MnmD [Paracoccaceae bacterium]
MAGQQAELEWRDGVPVSTRFADPYYSLENGLAETRHVFLAGNALPGRLLPGFHVAELGVGTGLNLLALVALVRETGRGPVRYTGFEAFPLSANDMRAALAAFPEVADDAEALVAAWESGGPLRTPGVEATFVFGDARQTLPRWSGKVDAWFLDGFAPARNPELWEPGLLAEVARHTAPGGTAATYSAAGEVRRSLAAAGFEVERRPGYGRKRHMTVARLP